MSLENLFGVQKIQISNNLNNMNNLDFFGDLSSDEELFNAYEQTDADIKFRSVKVESHGIGGYFPAYQQQSNSFSAPVGGQIFKSNTTTKSSSNTSGCPAVPFGVAKTNFIINKPEFTSVLRSIAENLSTHDNFDFSFVEGEHMWRGKYLSGSSCFELEVNLYQEHTAYTVAVRKVACDCGLNSAFTNFFNAMKTALCTDIARGAPARKAFCIPTGVCLVKVSDDEFLQGILPVFRMAEHNNESRVQCAKMLCDVSQKDAHYLELSAFRPQCVKLLESLVLDESEDVRQYAVMAIAAFAELPSYKEAFMCSSILPVLFGLVENCCDVQQAYETAQVRRTAARVLALLSRTHPFTVRSELAQQQCDVANWLLRVSCLQDARTREYALIAKSFLEEVSPSVNNDIINATTALSFVSVSV